MLKNFLDKFDILHLGPNPKFDESENGLTFTGGFHAIYRAAGLKQPIPVPDLSLFIKTGDDGKPLFLPTPKSGLNAHMSLDNMHGIYILRELYHPKLELPTSRWYKPHGHTENVSKYWKRPDTLAFFGLLNKNLIWSILAPFILLFATYLSCKKERGITSGKVLWFQRYCLFSVSKSGFQKVLGRLGLKLMDKWLKGKHGNNPMIDVIKIYFKHPDHPMHEVTRKFYGL